jgi:hypothetical protein
MSTLRQLVLGILLLAAVAGLITLQHLRLQHAQDAARAAQAHADDLAGQLASAQASERIVTRYIDRVHTVYQRGATITREVPVYVTAHDDAACTIPAGFVRLYNAAAEAQPLPGPAGPADARPSGLALSTVAGTSVDNLTACHATAAQLIALQQWVRANQDGASP